MNVSKLSFGRFWNSCKVYLCIIRVDSVEFVLFLFMIFYCLLVHFIRFDSLLLMHTRHRFDFQPESGIMTRRKGTLPIRRFQINCYECVTFFHFNVRTVTMIINTNSNGRWHKQMDRYENMSRNNNAYLNRTFQPLLINDKWKLHSISDTKHFRFH